MLGRHHRRSQELLPFVITEIFLTICNVRYSSSGVCQPARKELRRFLWILRGGKMATSVEDVQFRAADPVMYRFRLGWWRQYVRIANRDERDYVDQTQQRSRVRTPKDCHLLAQEGFATHPLGHGANFDSNVASDPIRVDQLGKH